jgi:uncharacterized protein HemX
MDSDKWSTFLIGFVLGVLVALGVGGAYGWHQLQKERDAVMRARAETAEAMERARAGEEAARRQAAAAAEAERGARRELEEARKKLNARGEEAGGKDRE